MILFVPCQIGFVPCVGNREQASPANGIERTISILPVRKNNWKCENHRSGLFPGRIFNVQELCPERCSIKHTVITKRMALEEDRS